jgi:hypothetical protein
MRPVVLSAALAAALVAMPCTAGAAVRTATGLHDQR